LEDIVSILMMSLLGAFLLFVVLGAAWGALRGGKRAAFRLVTVVVACTLALLLTPAISGLVVNMTIPGLGKSAGTFLEETLFGDGAMAQVASDVPDVVTFAKSCAVVLVNFVMFFILYYVFKCLSWVVYAPLAHKFAPVKNKNGEGEVTKIKRYRWAGVGVGVITGIVFFGFFMIPVTGVMQTVDAAASYKAEFAGYNQMTRASIKDEGGIAGMITDVNDALTDVNDQIQGSFFGKLTKYTGLQLFGGWGVGYLSQVRTEKHSVNLRNDLMGFGRATSDTLAVIAEFTRAGNMKDKVEMWKDADYKMLKGMVENLFGIGVVNVVLDYASDIAGVLEENGTLDDMFEGIGGNEFIAKGYQSLKAFGTEGALRDDLIDFVDMAKLYIKRVLDTVDGVGGDGSFGDRISAFDKDAVAGVLDTVTNSRTIGRLVRSLISVQLDKIEFGETEGVNMDTFTDRIKENLDSDDELHWGPMLGQIISDILSELIENMTGITTFIAPGYEDIVAQAMINASEQLAGAFGGEGAGLDYTDPAELLEIFGELAALNTIGEPPVVQFDLSDIAGVGDVDEYKDSVIAAIEAAYPNDPDQAELMKILLGLAD
jgi:hypothetical protein